MEGFVCTIPLYSVLDEAGSYGYDTMSSHGNDSGGFIPFGESTPRVYRGGGGGGGWRGNRGQHRRGTPPHRWQNNSRNHNISKSCESQGIDAYLHPSMLQDPWHHLRSRTPTAHTSTT